MAPKPTSSLLFHWRSKPATLPRHNPEHPYKPPHSTLPSLSSPSPQSRTAQTQRLFSTTCRRNATPIHRPYRPYTFTQVITLSDGSTYTHRTTSPQPVYRSSKDTRNSPTWNPTNRRMANVEEDSTGRLRAFRARFGRGYDASRMEELPVRGAQQQQQQQQQQPSRPSPAGLAATARGGARTSGYEDEEEEEEGDEQSTAATKRGAGKVEIVDGVAARVDETATAAGKGVARPKDAGEQPAKTRKGATQRREWTDEDEENLMDLIGSFGTNKGGGGGAQSGAHLGGQTGRGGKPNKR